ncbi:MAG TPA: hypothetical protein VGJ05_08935 [Fimbriiglobus sp.]|jgi:hypothetical protein
MRRPSAIAVLATALAAGCISVPPLDNPVLVRPTTTDENPIVVAPGTPDRASYADVYERVLNTLDDDFDIRPSTRYSGIIETYPRTAPGFEQPWKPGSPDHRERMLATAQSMRYTAKVQISDGERGGYRVYVEVRKEVEDLPAPVGVGGMNTPSGLASFQEAPSVDRRPELIVASAATDRRWIPAGRDFAYEQKLLKKIQRACSGCGNGR